MLKITHFLHYQWTWGHWNINDFYLPILFLVLLTQTLSARFSAKRTSRHIQQELQPYFSDILPTFHHIKTIASKASFYSVIMESVLSRRIGIYFNNLLARFITYKYIDLCFVSFNLFSHLSPANVWAGPAAFPMAHIAPDFLTRSPVGKRLTQETVSCSLLTASAFHSPQHLEHTHQPMNWGKLLWRAVLVCFVF